MSELESIILEIDHNKETCEAEVIFSRWYVTDAWGESFVAFEIYSIACEADLSDAIVGAALADHLSIPFTDTIC